MTLGDTTKYLIHAAVSADGVVERSDVVGAIFGQTEGLLGDELDLRALKDSSKVGRIDVEVESSGGQSTGEVTIETSMDKVETATLAAALETITRIGPCRARIEVTGIEDVRAAKRRAVVDRATELLETAFDDSVLSSQEILARVREQVRTDGITEYEGLPAGPNVADSDAVLIVEGRSDVLQLLRFGIKNAVAVEGTDVPRAIADLTRDRTVTAFLDGDRGGDLILKELAQVGEIDYVAFAPPDTSVEDCTHEAVFAALREKVPYDEVADVDEPHTAVTSTDEPHATVTPSPSDQGPTDGEHSTSGDATSDDGTAPDGDADRADADGGTVVTDPSPPDRASDDTDRSATDSSDGTVDADRDGGGTGGDGPDADEGDDSTGDDSTLRGHVRDVIGGETGRVRLVDPDFRTVGESAADDAFESIADADEVPAIVVLDGRLDQRVLDVAAQRGVGRIVARELGEFTKRPTGVRIHTAEQIDV